MIDEMRLLTMASNSSLGSGSKCNCSSDYNDAFDMVMISLLKATATKNKLENNININININTNDTNLDKDKDTTLSLETQNTIQNTSKIKSSSLNRNTNTTIDEAISTASKKYGVDENLIKAIIKTESNFNPNAVSSSGAKGLMQIMPINYSSLNITDPFNIQQNINGGTRLLKEYLDKYNGSVEMALMAYNGGPTRMSNRGVTSINDIYKMPKETQNYIPKVMKNYSYQAL